MIMESLDTFAATPHHAFLLTESAAAAHFNVLSFDTCLLKTAATNTLANISSNNNNNLFTINHNTISATNNCIANCINTHNNNSTSNNHSTNNNSNHHHHPSHQTNAALPNQSNGELNLLQHSHNIERSPSTDHHQSQSISDVQTTDTDLNTPVTTSSDIPSFFAPNTVEPPPISGKFIHSFF